MLPDTFASSRQRWLVVIGTFYVLYVVCVSTTAIDFHGVDPLKATIVRIAIATGWLGVAAALLLRRSQEARPASFVAAAAIIVPLLLFAWIAFEGSKWPLGFFALAVSYAAINGFLCLTIQTSWRAGLAFAVVQVVVDVLAHFFAGTLGIH